MAKIKELEIADLINYERGAKIVCERIQDDIDMTRTNGVMDEQISEKFKELQTFNAIYLKIQDEIKRKLKALV